MYYFSTPSTNNHKSTISIKKNKVILAQHLMQILQSLTVQKKVHCLIHHDKYKLHGGSVVSTGFKSTIWPRSFYVEFECSPCFCMDCLRVLQVPPTGYCTTVWHRVQYLVTLNWISRRDENKNVKMKNNIWSFSENIESCRWRKIE